MLEIIDLSKTYEDGTEALKNVSFKVPQGQFLVLIGLSGSGKSTLLRCINRLVEPTAGQVIWDGRDITAASGGDLRKIRREIGMIFQHFNLVKRNSVLTNVISGRLGYTNSLRSMLNLWPKSVKEEAMINLDRVGIAEKAWNRADALSGGQQQRVGIARALMQQPHLMLADEPVASLDPALSHSIMDYLQDLNQQDGITIICSLHFLSLAREYGDRIIALKDGVIMFDGLPVEINDARFLEIYGDEAMEVEVR
ncbi:MAG: phosphonate ABC transporter ATP-binding protein [Chloroflexota bacterium]|nr:phosphonate ABC transporter ATP-binding protein [Chloroflexota bacterium]